MSEGEESKPSVNSLNRRDFLKLSGAALAAAAFGPKSPESLPPREFPVIALRVLGRNPQQVMNALETLLERRRVGLVVSPEYSFSPRRETDRELLKLHLGKSPEGVFEILDSSGVLAVNYVNNAALLARQSGSSIFLSSFSEYDWKKDNKYYETMLHIDPRGKIIGRKRKYNPPEGDFSIKVGGKEVKTLPLICQDAWYEEEQDPITGKMRTKVPEWIKRGAPYDLLVHSMAQADLNFEKLQRHVEGTFVQSPDSLPENWYIDAFKHYYEPYFPYLKANALIVSSDLGTAGVFTPSLGEIKKYADSGWYVEGSLSVK